MQRYHKMTTFTLSFIVVYFLGASILTSGAVEALQYKSFNGHQVIRIVPKTATEVKILSDLQNFPELDFWTLPYNVNHDVDIRVPPALQKYIQRLLSKKEISYSILIDNVQRALDMELEGIAKKRAKRDISSQITSLSELNDHILNSFSSHEEMNTWLMRISAHCGSRCTTHDIGHTHEGRVIRLIKISGSRRRNGTNKAIWIDGGIHGREWISPVTANNIIYRLINERGTDRCVRHIVENFDWYILPVANPDGYEYSRIRNRMWRKNRKASVTKRPWWSVYYYGSMDRYPTCYGVDLNRNFGFKWGESGTSSNPCSDIYGGPQAFSEPESVAIRNFTEAIQNRSELSVYLSLHAYGQYWLYSWGYTRQLPADHVLLKRIAGASADAISAASQGQTQYTIGAAARTLYASSGASDDWAKGQLGVKYAFTLELPPSDANARGNGFLLPVSVIPDVANATWPGIKAMASSVLQMDQRSTAHSRHEFCRPTPRSASSRM